MNPRVNYSILNHTNMFHGESSSRNAHASGIDLSDSTQPMGILDLNEESLNLNEQADLLPPNYFTHLLMEESIDETPELLVDIYAPAVDVHTIPTNSETGLFVVGTNTTSLAQDDADDNEASSQPMDPHIGMRYDTLQGAKEHYNAYAARTGFSIKVNRNRKSGRTNEISRQQFVCNNFRKPRNDDGGGDKLDVVGPVPSSESSDEEDRQNAELASVVAEIAKQKGQKKNPKKRKRETMIPTNCKAEMVVKLKDGRWEVIAFKAGHNHRLVHKPSLNKYLRSLQDIPAEEKDFVKNLHSTNLTASMLLNLFPVFLLVVPIVAGRPYEVVSCSVHSC
uniref:Uncharacterized protein n=1 Tax=Avena sativa TaxID=4498 RepID=A0ACD5YQB2_AVESA